MEKIRAAMQKGYLRCAVFFMNFFPVFKGGHAGVSLQEKVIEMGGAGEAQLLNNCGDAFCAVFVRSCLA